MKKFKQIFPSRNYITIDTFGETEVIFNPVGDGFEGDDKLIFRKGRWAFRVNDFLAGKTLPNGENEKMNRKVYSLGIVWDSADNEPIINTTYVDPTSVIPLDGSLVEISNTDLAKEVTLLSANGHLSAINTNLTTLFDVPLSTRASEATLATRASEETLRKIYLYTVKCKFVEDISLLNSATNTPILIIRCIGKYYYYRSSNNDFCYNFHDVYIQSCTINTSLQGKSFKNIFLGINGNLLFYEMLGVGYDGLPFGVLDNTIIGNISYNRGDS